MFLHFCEMLFLELVSGDFWGESGYARQRVNLQLYLWPNAVLDLYHQNIISHVCKCIHFTARVRITYTVMNQEMRADHSHERSEHDQR